MGMKPDRNEIEKTIKIIHSDPNAIIEIRAKQKGRKGMAVGYFDSEHHRELVEKAYSLSTLNYAVYMSLNDVDPQLISRYNNRIEMNSELSTSDSNILRRKWIIIDLDPIRPAETSTTDRQVEDSYVVMRQVESFLSGFHWPSPVISLSGNGYHLLYPIDLPNTDGIKKLIQTFLLGMSEVFSNDSVVVDKTMFNASRITKFYGTVSNKGDDTKAAPHRCSKITQGDIPSSVVTQEQIEFVIKNLVDSKTVSKQVKSEASRLYGQYQSDRSHESDKNQDLPAIEGVIQTLSAIGISTVEPVSLIDYDKIVLDHCPFNHDHKAPDAAVFVSKKDGRKTFKCFHNSCSDKKWKHVVELYEQETGDYSPKKKSNDFRKGKDPENSGRLEPIGSSEIYETITGKARWAGRIQSTLEQVVRCIRDDIWFPWLIYEDTFLQNILIEDKKTKTTQAITDNWVSKVRYWFDSHGWEPMRKETINDAIAVVVNENQKDSAQEWLLSLEWDGVSRLDEFARRIHADNFDYAHAVSRYWWSGMAGRIMKPGCQLDSVIILYGEQGLQKSSLLRVMAPEIAGQDTRAECSIQTIMGEGEKSGRALRGIIITELDEFSTSKYSDKEPLRSAITRRSERLVPKWKEHAVVYQRRNIFVATTNIEDMLSDDTGERRYLPLTITQEIDLEWVRMNKEQLWAEARSLFTGTGVAWKEAQARVAEVHKLHKSVDAWDMMVADYVQDKQVVSQQEILSRLGFEYKDQNRISMNRVNSILLKLGYVKHRMSVDNVRQYYFVAKGIKDVRTAISNYVITQRRAIKARRP